MNTTQKRPWLKYASYISIGAGILIGVALLIRRLFLKRQVEETSPGSIYQHKISGLSYTEVEERKTDSRRQARLMAEKEFQKDQLRRRFFSIFNITLLVMFITQLFMQEFWAALGILGALILNVAVTAFNQARSARQVGKLLSAARPKATAIREGTFNNIDQDDIVIGDVLTIGKGDEIFADGIVLDASDFKVDTTLIDLTPAVEEINIGERVRAGSYCESGWAIYRVERISEEIDKDQISLSATSISEVRTPLQKGIHTMLMVLLAIAGLFYVILITELLRFDYFPSELILIYRHAISIIFSIAPAGLVFMVIINYAVGSANIAKAGALIRSSHTIEELAHISSLLLIRRRNLDSLSLKIEMIPDETGQHLFTETRTRQLLGNYLHSVPSMQFPFSAIKDELEGNRHHLIREARFFSLLGWEAVNFDSEDMAGTYVIGYPDSLKSFLENPQVLESVETQLTEQPETRIGLRERISNLWAKVRPKAAQPGSIDQFTGIEQDHPPDDAPSSRWERIKSRFQRRAKIQHNPSVDPAPEKEPDEVIRLLFAYTPKALLTGQSIPQPPRDLIPVGYLSIIKAYRPDVRAALKDIQQAGINLKIVSSGQLHNYEGLAKELGIEDQALFASQVISGDEFTQQVSSEDIPSICDKRVYYQLSTEQMMQLVDILHNDGAFIAIKSSSNADIPLMSQSDINITTQGSSHKIISYSDVVLMNNAPSTLPTIFSMSQKIVQSVVNLLKINLTEIGYVLLLILLMFLVGSRQFIYEPVHGGIIGIFTIALPSFFISIWSASLNVDRKKIPQQLGVFIIPAMVTVTLAVLATLLLFDWRAYPFFRIQQVTTHLLILIGLLLVIFCYPPIPLLSGDGRYVSDWRMIKVALILYILLYALTFLPLFQRYLRLYPLETINEFLLVWGIGVGWGLLTLLAWRIVWFWMSKRTS
jgi:magnesium-transporting ATPase (P-type)